MRIALATVLGASVALALAPAQATAAYCDKSVAVGRSVEGVINGAKPGQRVCLRGGVHTDPNRQFRITARGDAGRLITVQSHPRELATLKGRLLMNASSRFVRVMHVVLDGSGGPVLGRFSPRETYPSPSVSGQSISFLNVEITSRRTGTCLQERPPQLGYASYVQLRYSLVHDCGSSPPTNHGHGVYLEVPTSGAQITDNWIYDNADRCVQMYPDADRAYVARNVLDGCGEGVMFGGSAEDGSCAASDGNVVEHNVISNANARWLVEAWWGCEAVGVGNVVRGNCLWPTNSAGTYNLTGGLDRSPGYSDEGNVFADPRFADRAGKDFRLSAGSPCAGKGPRVVPGPRRDVFPPRVWVGGPRIQRFEGGLRTTLRCSEACAVRISAAIVAGGARKALPRLTRLLAPDRRQHVLLPFGAGQARFLRRSLSSGRSAKAIVLVQAEDQAHNKGWDLKRMRLKRARGSDAR